MQGNLSTLRVVVFIVASLILMVIDHRYDYLKGARTQLSVVILPLQYAVDSPIRAAQWLSANLHARQQLLEENTKLREENLHLHFTLQKFEDLKSENARLRQLLNSSISIKERVLIAEVLAVENDPYSRKITLNKGSYHGVYNGQAVLDAQGIMGQIVNCGRYQSVAMLITDERHALPVQVVRTGLRTIADGMGRDDLLSLRYLPNNVDIMANDLLVTYEFTGSEFPAGYPVGQVIEVTPDIAQPYAKVRVVPSALLERNREVLLVWKEKTMDKIQEE
ncbi:MAG: rod shape-determining protein MreC [Beggiatoa sp. IS2]|nr:MAG: rod shape-determining protein MreC [Beggiatoa sp. IS2]